MEEFRALIQKSGLRPPTEVDLGDGKVIKQYQAVSILEESVNILSVISHFIHQETGRVSTDAEVLLRQDTRLNSALAACSLPLYEDPYLNPQNLHEIIEHSNLPPSYKRRLIFLVPLAMYYKKYYQQPNQELWKAREDFSGARAKANRALHDLLTTILQLNLDNPAYGHAEAVKALRRIMTRRIFSDDYLDPINIEVPFHKNPFNAPDEIEYSVISYNPLRYVANLYQRSTIVTGGPSNCGKTTSTASIAMIMWAIEGEMTVRGLQEPQSSVVGVVDLDLGSPTLWPVIWGGYIDKEERAKSKREWCRELALEAQELRIEEEAKHRILVCDIPGKIPDDYTRIVTRGANLAIRVDAEYPEGGIWDEYQLGHDQPTQVAVIHSLRDESGVGRSSGAIRYLSKTRPRVDRRGYRRLDSRNFLFGRVYGLDRKPRPEDPFLRFVAHELMFNTIPHPKLWPLEYSPKLGQGVNYDQPIHYQRE